VTLPPFQVLLETHQDDVYRFLVRTVGLPEAEDCLQETFLSALGAYPKLRHDDNLRGWLMSIAHRKAIDHHRQSLRRAMPEGDLRAVAGSATAPAGDGRGEVWEWVRRLPPKQLMAVAHRYVNDLPYRDIARLMGCTEEAARRNVHEGVKRLREVYLA
jgi:RNA polymerase sigma factor (sigma-70 family)